VPVVGLRGAFAVRPVEPKGPNRASWGKGIGATREALYAPAGRGPVGAVPRPGPWDALGVGPREREIPRGRGREWGSSTKWAEGD
jgi:hypothetical protein